MLRRSLQAALSLRWIRRAPMPMPLAHPAPASNLTSHVAVAASAVPAAAASSSLSAASLCPAVAARAPFSTVHAPPRPIPRFTPIAAAASHSKASMSLHSKPTARQSTMLFVDPHVGQQQQQQPQRRSKHSKAQRPSPPHPAASASASAALAQQPQPASHTPAATPVSAAAVDSTATPRPVSAHNVPSFLRPSSATAAPATAAPATAATSAAPSTESRIEVAAGGPFAVPVGVMTTNAANASAAAPNASPATSAAATAPAATPAASSSASGVDPATGAAAVGTSATAAHTTVPTFLRPAPAAPIPILHRLQRHRWYKYWPNIGYLISVTGLLVTDILWLRSIIIVANFFGIAVHYSFSPPFWTGIYWSCFFILANLVHIGLILYDRRAVHLSDEEQRVYDATFASVFSPQEFRRLLSQGEWHDLAPGTPLMQQGEEIEAVHWVSAGVCVVEQEKLTPLSAEEAEARRRAAAAGTGEKPACVQQRRINGQPMLVSILDPPIPGSTLAAASSSASSSVSSATGGASGVNLGTEGAPPSIGKSLLQSVLQGGLSWMDRVRVVPGPGRGGRGPPENEHAADLAPAAASTSAATAHRDAPHTPLSSSHPHHPAHTDTTEESQAPAPLPSSHIHLHLPTHAHEASASSSGATAPTHAAVASPPSGASPPTVVDHPSLPEAIILPASSSSMQQPHAAPHAHHLLNVHVDSTDANSPSPTPVAATASNVDEDDDSTESSSVSRGREREREREREVLPVNSGLGDGFGFDMLHESSRSGSASKSSSAGPFSSTSSSSSTALDDDDDASHDFSSDLIDEDHLDPMDKQEQLQLTRRAMEAASGAQPLDGRITHEHVLARWRADRESHRAARMREKEARIAQRAALAEQKRLRGLSALERQFGQAASSASATGDKKRAATNQQHTLDASSDAATAAGVAAASVAASSSGALVPSASSAASSSAALSPASTVAQPSGSDPSLTLPAFERHSSVLGYVRAGRLIGEMCLVSPSSSSSGGELVPEATGATTNSYAIAPVSVTTAAPTRVLSWDRRDLQRLFFVLPSLAVGWYSVVSTDLVNRLHAQRASAAAAEYTGLMTGVLSDGTVSERQRLMLASYRAQHEIPPEMHARTLQQLGWSAQDFERGSQQRGWMEAWLGSGASSSNSSSKGAPSGSGPGPASSSA